MRSLLVLVVASFLPLAAFAASEPMSPNGGSDSCGLGWKVTEKRSLLGTCTRGTTNSYTTPFALTTGTLGCEKHTIAKADAKGAEFVVQNYDSLRLEMAAGQGETLAALARTMGCSDASVGSFGNAVQGNYEMVIGNGSRIEMFQNVKNVAASACAI